MTYRAIKGTKDILPADAGRWQYVESVIREVFRRYNYREIRTPVFEQTTLFARSIGELTDIVGKDSMVGPHIKLLSRISRLMNKDDFRKKLLASQTPTDVMEIFRAEEATYFDN